VKLPNDDRMRYSNAQGLLCLCHAADATGCVGWEMEKIGMLDFQNTIGEKQTGVTGWNYDNWDASQEIFRERLH
jgi:hypothetical protein